MAIVYYPDGTHKDVLPKNGKSFTLDELQECVGGWVEHIPVRVADCIVLADEDGLMKRLPVNPTASTMAGRVLVGPIMFLTDKEMGS